MAAMLFDGLEERSAIVIPASPGAIRLTPAPGRPRYAGSEELAVGPCSALTPWPGCPSVDIAPGRRYSQHE